VDPTPQLEALKEYSPVYEEATIPADTYDLEEDAASIAVPNHLLVREDMRENVACALTNLVFDETQALLDVHPAAADIAVETGVETDPVELHPGSQRAFDELQ
jgi:TRAP transporter TAXI family solute receptor